MIYSCHIFNCLYLTQFFSILKLDIKTQHIGFLTELVRQQNVLTEAFLVAPVPTEIQYVFTEGGVFSGGARKSGEAEPNDINVRTRPPSANTFYWSKWTKCAGCRDEYVAHILKLCFVLPEYWSLIENFIGV